MNLSETNDTLTPDTFTFVYGVATLFSLNIFVGLPANVYVVSLICGGGRGTPKLFAFNLALSEILFCFLSLYLLLHFLLNVSMGSGYTCCSLPYSSYSSLDPSAWSATWLWCIPPSSSGNQVLKLFVSLTFSSRQLMHPFIP